MGLGAPQQLWIIGGTQESAAVVGAIASYPQTAHPQPTAPYLVSVTTPTATQLYPKGTQVWVGQLTPETLPVFLETHQVGAILDASHPFATVISELAIAASHQYALPYLRYERPACTDVASSVSPPASSNILTVPDYAALLSSDRLANQRVLLTLGYRALPLFTPWQKRATLFARILPSAAALAAALAAGFLPQRLIAVRPPLTAEFEKALWQQWQISTVVTKASGHIGGENTKRQIAQALGVKLIIIERPAVAYPRITDQLSQAVAFAMATMPNPLPRLTGP
ncbi:MAG: cobalt-precorrin-6A reductase [Cyanobacteria bacterium P01_A01_bin.114]